MANEENTGAGGGAPRREGGGGGDRPRGGPRREGGGGGRYARRGGGRGRRRVCRFCAEKSLVLDYKWWETIEMLTSERGRIIPSRTTGTCAKHQRRLTIAIKRARHIGLLPYARG